MDYIKIRFGKDFDRISSKFEKTLEDMFQAMNPMFMLSERTWSPQMDMYETPEEIVVRAEIAGVEKENLEVEINSKALKISGKRTEMPGSESGKYRLAEIQYGRFERMLFFPVPIDTEVVASSFSNGLLHIRLAKMQVDKTHKIPIEDG